MALDHVRDYFHVDATTADPLDLNTTTPILFFTRWVTHFCAPTFVLLSGTSIYLQSLRKTSHELGVFLLKRGAWLILIEITVVTFVITFNPFLNMLILQVIWSIGISMVILGLLILLRVPYRALLIIGALIVLGHNAFDYMEAHPGFQTTFIWDLLHSGRFSVYPIIDGYNIVVVYPFLAWTGVMILGFCLGKVFTTEFGIESRKKLLLRLGAAALVLFVVLRFIDVYGDPVRWTTQETPFYTFLSFITITKYPPSLFFLCVTLGVALIALAYLEGIKNRFTDAFVVFGRTAFFYYIVHFFVIHLASAIAYLARGHSFEEGPTSHFLFWFVAPGEGYDLWMVYAIWVALVLALYPLCKWYDDYKTTHRERWWLSYL
jgi:uncharacterized membrane protein